MKRITTLALVALIAAFTLALLPAATFAQTTTQTPAAAAPALALPDYEKTGKQYGATLTCDQGGTTVLDYSDEKTYDLSVATTKSGQAFYLVSTPRGEEFYHRTAGDTEAKSMSHAEWDKALRAESPAYFGKLHGGGGDCKK